jgi:hypothetical protein
MRSMRPLRPARTTAAHTPSSRSRATATVAFGAALGMITIAGITAASAAADVGSSPAVSAVTLAVPAFGAEPIHAITAEATATLDAARAAVTAAEQVTSDVAASGLDVGVPTTTVDAAALQDRIKRLSPLEKLPLLFLPSLTDDAAHETQRIAARTADLREHLDAAIAKKAAEEAAAQAQREAEAAAAAAAAAAATANTPDGARATARQLLAEHGWGSDQFSCLDSLWNKESGWNYQASNGSSGAFGIPQSLPGSKMATAGADWQTNAGTQIRWGLDYIARAYGSPCCGWAHSLATKWFCWGGARGPQTPPPPPPPPPPPAEPPPLDPPEDEDDEDAVLADSDEMPDENDAALKPLVPEYQVGEFPAP